jgi:hypothetical protein
MILPEQKVYVYNPSITTLCVYTIFRMSIIHFIQIGVKKKWQVSTMINDYNEQWVFSINEKHAFYNVLFVNRSGQLKIKLFI